MNKELDEMTNYIVTIEEQIQNIFSKYDYSKSQFENDMNHNK